MLSICLTISTLHFTIPYGFGAAARFDLNQRKLLQNHLHFSVIETVVLSTSMLGSRRILGRTFSNETQVVDYIAAMTPLLCLSIVTDSLQAVISEFFGQKLLL